VVDVLPAERVLLAPFLERAGDAVTVLCGPPDFERYKALLARLALLVTPNTGPMHVAAAVGTPVVALFSGWSPAECGPFVPADRVRILRAEDTPTPERGLAAIGADTVFEACAALLSSAA
jgi:ADP-heptose:LPS heptosyltransferase